MICIRSIHALRSLIAEKRRKSDSIGFVPTMGALHNGHISLIKRAKAENALCVASIFVNPLQFNNTEDFNKYPIQHETDIAFMEAAGCDILFMPSAEEFYPSKPKLTIDIGRLDQILEGIHRPGHFSGVAIVVSKLFNVVMPDKAYFGQKDIQQLAVINQLVEELNFPISIISCPIVREQNGLAMSSRNTRLSETGKTTAAHIYKALCLMEETLKSQIQSIEEIRQIGFDYLNQFKEFELEYLEIVDGRTLEVVKKLNQTTTIAICIAIHLEGVRLIDNLVIIL
jgi:pantoate--beta-alanine ligase